MSALASFLATVFLGSGCTHVMGEPDAISTAPYYPGMTDAGSVSHTWTCGVQVLSVQISWGMGHEPLARREFAALEISRALNGRGLTHDRFEKLRQRVIGFSGVPEMEAACEADPFFVTVTLGDAIAAWSSVPPWLPDAGPV